MPDISNSVVYLSSESSPIISGSAATRLWNELMVDIQYFKKYEILKFLNYGYKFVHPDLINPNMI